MWALLKYALCVCVCVCVCKLRLHSASRPRVADGGDGLQIWKVAGYILNKQLRTAVKGWSSNLRLDDWLTTPHRKKKACYEMLHSASDLDGFY
jgi:hypothetical protein